MLIAQLFLLVVLFEFVRVRSGGVKKPFWRAFGGLFGVGWLLVVCFLFISLLYGLFAVLVYRILELVIFFEQIKGVVNAFTVFFTWVLTPLVLNIVFTYGLGRETVWRSLTKGVAIPARRYVRFLVAAAVTYGFGWLVVLPFRYVSANLLLDSFYVFLHALIGAAALTVAFAVFYESEPKSRLWIPKTKAVSVSETTGGATGLVLRATGSSGSSGGLVGTGLVRSLGGGVLCVALVVCILFSVIPNAFAVDFVMDADTDFERSDDVNVWEEIQEQSAVILKDPRLFVEVDDFGLQGAEVYHDRFSRTFLLEDGSYVTRISDEPLTFTDGSGVDRDIDNTLVVSGQGYRNKANGYSLLLPGAGEGVSIQIAGVTLQLVPLFGELSNGVAVENAIRYNGVAAGIDLQYTAAGSLVKEDIILNYPTEFASFSYELKAQGVVFEVVGDVLYGFVHGQTEPTFTIKAPVMVDASGVSSDAIVLTLDGNVLSVTPDSGWLASPERAYPVTIDPAYSLSRTALTYGTVQAYAGPASGPNTEHRQNPYLFVGLERGDLIGVEQDGEWITYGQSWTYVKIDDIAPYISALPDNAILSASLSAYKYSGAASPARAVCAKMIAGDWGGDGRFTWNNRPFGGALTDLANAQDVSGGSRWVTWDITDAFKEWWRDPSSNRGVMLTPLDESQAAVALSSDGNVHGGAPLSIDLRWSVPNAIDEQLALGAPNVNLRPLTYKNVSGLQNFTGLFADGQVRPTLQVDYALNDVVSGVYSSADYGRTYPDSDLFSDEVPFTLGWYDLFESNWQSELFYPNQVTLNTLYAVYAQGTVTQTFADAVIGEQTAIGKSDDFIIYQLRSQDTLPFVANFYGVTREQIVSDNRTGDDLAMPGNTIFIRNPQKNATVAYSRPDNLTLEQKRAIIYANMGRSQTSEFDIEPVNMNTGNFYFESVDAENAEYSDSFKLMRTYNSLSEKSMGSFGYGWSFEYQQTLTGRTDGGMTLHDGDGKQLIFPSSGAGWLSPTGHNLVLTKFDDVDQHKVHYEIRDENGVTRSFDSYGILRKITDEKGFVTTVNYTADYRLTGVTTGSGRTYSFTTNVDGLITSVTLPNGGILRYEYSSDGFLTAFINADNERVLYVYDSNAQLSEWFDGRGLRVIRNEYDNEGRVVKQTDAAGGVSELTYSLNQTTLKNAENSTVVYEYDAQYRTTKIDDAGNDVTKTWDVNNRQTSVTDKTGSQTWYAYDSKGNVTKETRSDGSYREVVYNAQNKPISVRDFDAAVTQNFYDANGFLSKVKKPDGTEVKYAHDQYGRVTSITDGEGGTTSFAYNGLSSMVMTDALGNSTTFYYDAMGRLVNEVDSLGVEHKTMYSLNGKKIGVWETGGVFEEYEFDAAGNCVAVIDANGNKSVFTYNALNQMVKAQNPLGVVLTYSYDLLGNRLSEKDSLGNETRYEYNSFAQVTKMIDAAGDYVSNEYSSAAQLVKTVDKQGNITTYQYDPVLNLPIKIVSPAGTLQYTYDSVGRMTTLTNPDGTRELYSYDILGRIKSVTSVSGLVTSYEYNSNSQVSQVSDSAGRVVVNVYDLLGRLTATTDPLNRVQAYEYDSVGRLVKQTAPGDLVSVFGYDTAGNLVSVNRPDNETLRYVYDNNGNLSAQLDAAGNRTEYRYNAVNELLAVIDALDGTLTFAYNGNQMLTEQTGALSQRTKYEYDKLNRLVKIVDPNANVSQFEYDKNGNVTAVVAADGTRELSEYDSANRVTKITDGEGLVTAFSYDSGGRKVREWDNAGHETRYEYNSAGQVIKQTDSLNRSAFYTYDVAGNLIKTVDFNGDTTEYTYDLLSRPVAVKSFDGRLTTFTYDVVGNLVKQTDADGLSNEYEYDKLGRVLKALDPAGQETAYSYDALGNLIQTLNPDGTQNSYVYDALNRTVASVDGKGNSVSYGYDASSRLISTTDREGATREYIYDLAGNVTKSKDPFGFVSEYVYDALHRVSKIISPLGAETTYVYNKQSMVIKETDALGALTQYSYTLDGNLSATTAPSGLVNSYFYDAVGRVTKVADSTGLFRETEYDVSGNVVLESDQNGAEVVYKYDNMHRVTQIVNPLGAPTLYEYDERGNLINSVLPTGAEMSYTYDILDRVLTGTKSLSEPVSYSYDAMGRVVAVTQGEKTYLSTYDANGNVLTQTNPLGDSVSYTYDKNDGVVTVTDFNGGASSVKYDLVGRVIENVDALGGTVTTQYDSAGNITERTDALGFTSTYTYDLLNRLTGMTDSGGRTAHYTYDMSGNLSQKTIAASSNSFATLGEATQYRGEIQTTKYSYDPHGNLTEIISPSGRIERFEYDISSRLTTTIKSDGNKIEYDYDLLNNLLTKSFDGVERAVVYAYDALGRRLNMADASGTTSYTYDAAGRLATVTSGDGKTLSYYYDDYARMSAVEYPDARIVAYEYDLADRLIKVSDSVNGETLYTYDKNANVLLCERASGVITKYVYDTLNRLTSISNETDGKVFSNFSYTYDAAGQILSETAEQDDHSSEKTFTYDAAGQLKKYVEILDGETTITSYSYNQFGNRIASVKGEQNYRIFYEYNNDGQLVKQTNDGSGETIEYSYDADGNLTNKTVNSPTTTIGLFAANTLTETAYSYDIENRLRAVREGGALLMAATYDGDSNRVFQLSRTLVPFATTKPEQADGIENGSTPNLSDTPTITDPYLQTDDTRLPNERTQIPLTNDSKTIGSSGHSTSDTTAAYSYYEQVYADAADTMFWYGFTQGMIQWFTFLQPSFTIESVNWFSDAWETITDSFTLTIHSDSVEKYNDKDVAAFRAAGLSEQDIYDITHPQTTPLNQNSVQQPGGNSTQNSYVSPSDDKQKPENAAENTIPTLPNNADTPITIPVFPDETTRIDYELTYYLNDVSLQNTQVVMEFGKRDEVKNVYTYGLERLNTEQVDGSIQEFLYDGRGSVTQILSGTQVVQSLTYDPFGEITSGANTNNTIYGYNAEEYNPVTGLQYLRARYYAPEQASFITEDDTLGTLTNLVSQNRYTYAENDPVNNQDPSGHSPQKSSYEYQMEAAGGINEIYNFYVGNQLQNGYNHATSAFYGQLNTAQNTDYTSLDAVNSISSISQGVADYYINRAVDAAYAVGATYGCTPGGLVKQATGTFTSDVNAAKANVNTQITAIKDNKTLQYSQYQEYLAKQAELERRSQVVYGTTTGFCPIGYGAGLCGPLSASSQVNPYDLAGFETLTGFSFDFSPNAADYYSWSLGASEVVTRGYNYAAYGFNVSKVGEYAIVKGTRGAVVSGTRYALKNAAQYPNVFKYIDPKTAIKTAFNPKTLSGALNWVGTTLNVGIGVYENIQEGTPVQRIVSDAIVDAGISAATIAVSAAAGAAVGSVLPGIGNIVGAAAGLLVGIGSYVFMDAVKPNGKSLSDRLKEGIGRLFGG
jgi:RHS repeat-associated protein